MPFLFRQIDIASLCFFRVIFGLLALIEIISVYIYQNWMIGAYNADQFRFKYYGFQWVEPLPEPLLSLVFFAGMCGAAGIMLGWRYRLSAAIFTVSFAYSFLLEKAFYLNHGYLFSVLSFVMIWLPAHHNYSIDVWQKRVKRVKTIPYWPVFTLCFLMAVVYFYGGIAKMNNDWINGLPLKVWLKSKSNYFVIGPLLAKEWVAYAMSYGGLLLDSTIVFFLIFKRTRPWAFGAVILFHFINMLVFQIGIFPWLSTTLTAMFFPANFPRQLFKWLGNKIPKLQRLAIDRWNEIWSKAPEAISSYSSKLSYSAISVILIIFFSIQLLIPLRQHLFDGKPAWTERGHRYAWRMMLRGKSGKGSFKIVEPHSGKTKRVRTRDFLYKRQNRKMYGQPDMILQFAHFLRDKYAADGWKNPEIYADIKVKLNGRPYERFVDLERDLGKVEWKWFGEMDWILEEPVDEVNE